MIDDFRLRKVVLRIETCVAVIELSRKKFKKFDFLLFLLRKKWFPSLRRISWGNFWHSEKRKTLKLGLLQV